MSTQDSDTAPVDGPGHIRESGWWWATKRVLGRIINDNFTLVAAGVAFWGLLSLFPGIIAMVAIFGLVLDPLTLVPRLEAMTAPLPDAAREIVIGQIVSVVATDNNGLSMTLIVGVLVALYSASAGVGTLITGLNVAYGQSENRGFIALKIRTIILTLFLMTILVVAAIAFGIIPATLAMLTDWPFWTRFAQIARWPALFLFGVLAFAMVYRFGPARDTPRLRWLAPGSVAACLMWVAASGGFAWYVQNLAHYNQTFGALGGVVVLMIWLWISAFVTLLGALLDAELEAYEHRRRARREAETSGIPTRPD